MEDEVVTWSSVKYNISDYSFDLNYASSKRKTHQETNADIIYIPNDV